MERNYDGYTELSFTPTLLSIQLKEVLKNTSFLETYKFDVVETEKGLVARFVGNEQSNGSQIQAKDRKVNDIIAQAAALPTNYQIKGKKMQLSSRRPRTFRNLYYASSRDSSETKRSLDSTDSGAPIMHIKKPSVEPKNGYYYTEKFQTLKGQIQMLHQVISKRSKIIESLNNVVRNLHEDRKRRRQAD